MMIIMQRLFRMIIIMSTPCQRVDPGEIGAAQFAWLEACCPEGWSTALFLHFPPLATGIAGMNVIGLSGSESLAA